MDLKEIREQVSSMREEIGEMPKMSWDKDRIWDLYIIVEMILDYLQEKEIKKEVR